MITSLTIDSMEDSNNLPLCEFKIKRSLIISPNLDALLEHEERARALSTSPLSSRSVSPSDEFPLGLPPPPRYSRRVKTPHSITSLKGNPEDKEPQARQVTPPSIFVPTSCSISNPYINPAPTLAELLVHTPSKVSPSPKSSVNSLSLSRPHDHEQSSYASESSPIIITSPKFNADNSGQQPHPSALSIPTNPYSKRNVDVSIQNPDDDRTKPLSSALLQAHAKAKPEDPGEHTSVGHKNSSATSSAPYFLGQTQGVASSSAAPAAIYPGSTSESWRQRPLISHARPPFGPLESNSSVPSTPTENEHRISVSSTIYPPSSTHSHSYSLYNDPVFSLTKSEQNRDLHMEIYSPSSTEFNFDSSSMDCPQLSPIQFSKISLLEYSPPLSPRSLKPPIPTTPKPVFSRTLTKPAVSRQAMAECPKASGVSLPPTTNFLDAEERADLVRKTRKLARVFGQTPRADAMPHGDKPEKETPLSPIFRCSLAFNDLDWPILRRRRSALQLEPSSLNGGRRHSVPLSPNDMPFMTNLSPSFDGHLSTSSDQAGHHAQAQIRSKSSPISFSDLSDALDGDDFAFITPETGKMTRLFPALPAQLQVENVFEEHPDEDRRRKRERLAKLHRFLGCHVPVNLVLGIDNVEASLPPLHHTPADASNGGVDPRKTWLRRRRSSSALLSSSHWPNDLERLKEELNDQEKLINVRRAVKMEKVFGVAPPQTLYHTRHCPPPPLVARKSAPSGIGPTSSPTASPPLQTSQNRYTYMKHKKNGRPSTSESNILLLPKDQQTISDLANEWGINHSAIYNHYQYSLNSLHDILDRDDKESLVELHQYLNESSSTQIEAISPVTNGRRMSNVSSIRSGRRRSLPTITSITSLDSEYGITWPEIDVIPFQVRRRRAAKLTQFFGVDYRELINDILQSIESGLDHEHKNGTLHAEEFEDLRARLRNLKSERQIFL